MRKIEEALAVSFPPVGSNTNVSPSTSPPVVRRSAEGFELVPMRWGLVPHWSKEPRTRYSTFNARVETAAEKPAFRESFRHRRCLVPAEAFYEWKEEDGVKIPWTVKPVEGGGFAFAGLWDGWGSGGEAFSSFTILVGEPNRLVATIHDRMPVILDEDAYRSWLDPTTQVPDLAALLAPYPASRLVIERRGPKDRQTAPYLPI